MFSPIKLGGWAFEEKLTSAQMNLLNSYFPRAIDGEGGGTYTLVAPLVLQGALVTIDQLQANTITFGTLTVDKVIVAGGVEEVALANGYGTQTPDLEVTGRYIRYDGTALTQPQVELEIAPTFVDTDGRELIIEIVQSASLHGAISYLDLPGIVRGLADEPSDKNRVDPRIGTTTTFYTKYNTNNGAWILVDRTVSDPTLASPTAVNSSGFSSYIRDFLTSTSVGPQRDVMKALMGPMTPTKPFKADYSNTYRVISNIVYSPATRAAWGIGRQGSAITRQLVYSYDGSTWNFGANLDSSKWDNRTQAAITLVPNVDGTANGAVPGSKQKDRILIVPTGYSQDDQESAWNLEQTDDGNNSPPSIVSAGGASSTTGVTYTRLVSIGFRFGKVTDFGFDITAVGASSVINDAVSGAIADAAVAPDRSCLVVREDGEVYLSQAVDLRTEDPSFSLVHDFSATARAAAHCSATDTWVVLLADGTIWASQDQGATIWSQVQTSTFTTDADDFCQLQGIGGVVLLAQGRSDRPSTARKLVSFNPRSDTRWFRLGGSNPMTAGGCWLNGRLCFPGVNYSELEPVCYLSEPVGDLGPMDFDKSAGG